MIWFALLLTVPCQAELPPVEPGSATTARTLFRSAGEAARQSRSAEALDLLRRSLEAGLQTPLAVLTDPRFQALLNEPRHRAALRELLKQHARQSEATLVQPWPPASAAPVRDWRAGHPLALEITLVDDTTRAPVPGATIELVHTDPLGHYATDTEAWNPRWFAVVLSDRTGHVRLHTSCPGSYKDDEGSVVPAHVHFSITAAGYRSYASEFQFDGDPQLTRSARAEAVEEHLPIAQQARDDAVLRYRVTIPLQRDRTAVANPRP